MKYSRYVLVPAVIVVGVMGCARRAADETILLSTNRDDQPTRASSKPSDAPADNGRCHVCHMNYEDEELAVSHARNGVGCATCHGESDAHCGDENNITPPEIMYPKETIASACRNCHDALPDDEPHTRTPGATATEGFCTDCHGRHRLAYRTHRWNRKTGALIAGDG